MPGHVLGFYSPELAAAQLLSAPPPTDASLIWDSRLMRTLITMAFTALHTLGA